MCVWHVLQQPSTLEDICVAVWGEYDVDPQQCRADVAAFVDELRAYGLVETSGVADR